MFFYWERQDRREKKKSIMRKPLGLGEQREPQFAGSGKQDENEGKRNR